MCVGACAVNILFDQEQLLGLVSNLYLLTGMAANILDPQGRDINLFGSHPPFCRAMNVAARLRSLHDWADAEAG